MEDDDRSARLQEWFASFMTAARRTRPARDGADLMWDSFDELPRGFLPSYEGLMWAWWKQRFAALKEELDERGRREAETGRDVS